MSESISYLKNALSIRNLISYLPVLLKRGVPITELEIHITRNMKYSDLTASFFNLPLPVIWRILFPKIHGTPTSQIIDYIVFMITPHPEAINLIFPYVDLTQITENDAIKLSCVSKEGTAIENFISYINSNQQANRVEIEKVKSEGRRMVLSLQKALNKQPGDIEYQLAAEYKRGFFIEPNPGLYKKYLTIAVNAKHADAMFMMALEMEEDSKFTDALNILTKNIPNYNSTIPHIRDKGKELLYSKDQTISKIGETYINYGIKRKDPECHYILGKFILSKWSELKKGYNLMTQAASMNVKKATLYLQNLEADGGFNMLVGQAEAAKESKVKADKGDAIEMINYAVMRNMGVGVEKNIEIAAKYLENAAKAGNSIGMNLFGSLLLLGYGINKDYEKAAHYFSMSCKMNNPDGMVFYGYMLETGRGVPQNREEAYKLYEKASNEGNSDGLLRMGLYKLNYEHDNAGALEKFQQAAKEGNPNAYFCLGWMSEKGKGKPMKLDEAVKYYKSASDNGSDFGHIALGRAFEKGTVVEKNVVVAKKLYKKAFKAVNAENLLVNGYCLEKGEGAPHDPEYAALCYKVCADYGNAKGMYEYGRMLKNGLGVEKNEIEGIKYTQMARLNGYIEQ
ncbi:hypothetical protein TRFO_06497 [Tritrichomonas foetus]|uniref:Sel1 repeat family protein n=1 Tax=Tritrichomonas foetus TaxID=1144522 RepID=A0A1J4K3V4_9EUKA|nr:hypothetical protein TRFO_06497 [Tritrichomonas foetus]|eukprot:OHT04165.1 hypothetical protein TRFO_06497 [Tritrichomonas foetus]